jgi:hypothetical protein
MLARLVEFFILPNGTSRTMRIPPAMIRAFLASLLVVCGGCRDHSRVLALVLAVKGDVSMVAPAAKALSPGVEFASPAAIRTSADGSIVFTPLPGVMCRLEAGGEIGIDGIELRKRGEDISSRAVRLDLRRGCARLWVDEFRRGATDVRIRTPAGEVVFEGTALAEITLEPRGAARVICVSGTLLAAQTKLAAGEWVELAGGPEAPAAQVAADRDEIWKSLLATRDLEPQFLDLEDRQRTRTPLRGPVSAPPAPKN